MLSKNSPNLCRWRDELLLLFECFDFLGYKRTLVLLTEMYYNPVFDSCWKKKSLYPLYLKGTEKV